MTHSSEQNEVLNEENPCGSWGPDQKWSLVWFFSALVFGAILTITLAKIDSWMYYNEDQVDIAGVKILDNDKYRENRRASFGIASEQNDKRAEGSFKKALTNIE